MSGSQFTERLALTLLLVGGLGACTETVPTASNGDLIPIDPLTFEVLLPWAEFGTSVQVVGGFGAPSDLTGGVLAEGFQGVLDVRTLINFGLFPALIVIEDSLGITRPGEELTFPGGELTLFFDTIESTNTGPVTVVAEAITGAWDPQSATWTLASDSLGQGVPWPMPGGGPTLPIGTGVFDKSVGDTVKITIDSLTVASWADSLTNVGGLLLRVQEPGERLRLNQVLFLTNARATINPDTMTQEVVLVRDLTAIFQPDPAAPGTELRVGGVPSWRTVFSLDLPDVVMPPPEVCAIIQCPVQLTPERLNQAELVLTAQASEAGFQPSDTLLLDTRAVLAHEQLPKSPLGPSLSFSLGVPMPPELFSGGGGQTAVVPLTPFIIDLMEADPEGEPSPTSVALLTLFEPNGLSFASFVGLGGVGEPVLRLVLTVSEAVKLP